jgi:Ca2+-binding EF-hand superfamily protein
LKGVNEIVTISGPILEKIFSIMDINQIGLVDYDKFFTVLSIEIATNIPNPEKQINDGFEWQESVIRKIREWVINNKLGSVEAFRSYDRDLTGAITKESMRKSLIEFLGIDQSEITQNRMDRLFKMLSFYKQDRIQ